MQFKKNEMMDVRNKINNTLNSIGESNQMHDLNQQLENIEWFFGQFEQHGQFEPERVPFRGGWNVEEKNNAQKKDESDDIAQSRLVIARAALRLLQQRIPQIQAVCERCLELAGKDAVRMVCTPVQREGTDWQGKPYPPTAPELTLPKGYEPTLASKIKSAVVG
jgi:hypothetical protein